MSKIALAYDLLANHRNDQRRISLIDIESYCNLFEVADRRRFTTIINVMDNAWSEALSEMTNG